MDPSYGRSSAAERLPGQNCQSGLQQDMHTARYLLEYLGFVINLEKPTQQLEILGFVVNTRDITLLLPDCKAGSIKALCSALLCFSAGTISVDRQTDRLYPGCISGAFALPQFTTVETPSSFSERELRFPNNSFNGRTLLVASTSRTVERSFTEFRIQ